VIERAFSVSAKNNVSSAMTKRFMTRQYTDDRRAGGSPAVPPAARRPLPPPARRWMLRDSGQRAAGGTAGEAAGATHDQCWMT